MKIKYLWIGIGYDCAWHNNANEEVCFQVMEKVDASVENEGALNPTGSTTKFTNSLNFNCPIEMPLAEIWVISPWFVK